MFTTYFGQTVYDPLLTVITPADSQHELVLVPEGAFMMGSDDEEIDEQPVHTVTLSAYYVDKFEVTNAQYAALLNTIGSNVDSEGNDLLNLRNNNAQIEQTDSTFVLKSSDFANRPVIEVTWYGAAEYCEWMGGRLPTEAEWEKAARGTDARAYPWGDTLPTSDLANHNDEAGHTTDVGRYPEGASPYGALDMAGNVWEWVLDWNDIRYYADSPERDPQGPESGTFRVFRGGAWGSVSVCGGGVSRFSLTSPARSAGPSERI
jgi:formylglycine-generating enzyme required for sulfatase activity